MYYNNNNNTYKRSRERKKKRNCEECRLCFRGTRIIRKVKKKKKDKRKECKEAWRKIVDEELFFTCMRKTTNVKDALLELRNVVLMKIEINIKKKNSTIVQQIFVVELIRVY